MSQSSVGIMNRSFRRAPSRHKEKDTDDTRWPVWLEATESFYKKLNRIARECEVSRYEALRKGLDALLREMQIRNSPLNRNIKSPNQSEVFRRTMGQVSRNYWATVSPEERRERARKSAEARWSRPSQADSKSASSGAEIGRDVAIQEKGPSDPSEHLGDDNDRTGALKSQAAEIPDLQNLVRLLMPNCNA